MSYATPDDLKSLGLPAVALEELTDPDIQDQLDADSGVIDVFLSPRYSLPLTAPFPEFLRRCNVCLAVWHIMLRRGFEPEAFDQNYKTQFDECMALLKDIADGKLTIPGIIDNTPTVNEGRPIVVTKPLRGW